MKRQTFHLGITCIQTSYQFTHCITSMYRFIVSKYVQKGIEGLLEIGRSDLVLNGQMNFDIFIS